MVDDSFKLPIFLNTYKQKLNIRVLPSMSIPIILGIDALRAFRLSIHFGDHSYIFDSDPTRHYRFHTESEMASVLFSSGKGLMVVEDQSDIVTVESGPKESDREKESRGFVSLTPDQQKELEALIEREIPKGDAKPGVTNLAYHHIDVGDSPAIKQCYYPVSKVVETALSAEVDDMLAKGIIEPSTSD